MAKPGWAIVALLLPIAACQPFQTVSEDGGHVTYRFDPTKVSDSEVYNAAENKCEMSPLGSLRAVPLDVVDNGPMREIAFACQPLAPPTNIEPELDRALSKIPLS